MPSAADLDTLAAGLSRRATSAAIAGDRVALVAGQAHAYLKDRDVSIAQGITVDDPIVDSFFTGLSMACSVFPADEGRCSIDVRIEYQELLELMPVATGSLEVPEIELPRIGAVVDEVRTDMPLGGGNSSTWCRSRAHRTSSS